MSKHTRRSFLQLAGVGVASSALPSIAFAEGTVPSDGVRRKHESELSPVDLVNPMQGTDSSFLFSRGGTLPIIAVPFGMAHWTLQTVENSPWFFQPRERRIQGIRCTHQLSPWISDYGHATFLPVSGHPDTDPSARASSYRPEEVTIHPYLLEMDLLRYKTKVQLTPTERCAALRITYAGPEAGLMIDLPGTDAVLEKHGELLYATVHANSGGVATGFATYYAISADAPYAEPVLQNRNDRRVGMVSLQTKQAGAVVEIRIATSFISLEQATLNLHNEVNGKTFEELTAEARTTWEQHLSRAVVEGGTHDQRRIFYSAMYRALLFPRIWHEKNASGEVVHRSPYTGKVTPGLMYADHGYWDVYRAWYPFMSILFPERLGEILQAWVNAAQEGGWLPQFPCPGYRACMTGSLIDSVFGDAAAKGIKGFDLEAAYSFLKKHATQEGNPNAGYGRRGIEDYLRLGYVAADHTGQSVAETVDAAYGDFCIAQVARALGKESDAVYFEKRAGNWRHLYDPKVKFLRGKNSDGSWLEPFNPFQWGGVYVEGSAWQHRWDVPHDPHGLIEAMGGAKFAAEQLESMLTQPPNFDIGDYGREIHEMSEMAAVPFGQYAHSNQPVHHVLYMFAMAGRSDRLQYWVRRAMTELYTPETFPGDEDTGSMSAWFLLSAMGFYPLCPGKPEYVVGSPLFDRVTLTVGNGRRVVISARNNSAKNVYVDSCKLNGTDLTGKSLSHKDLIQGGVLEFTMRASPAHSRS